MLNKRVIIFGDESGLSIIRKALPSLIPLAVVYSSSRPGAEEAAKLWKEISGVLIFCQPERRDATKYEQFIFHIGELKPELGLCFSYDRILDSRVLGQFKEGIFNIHASLLPRYRGANVINWVLVNGESETGVTLHKMVREVDAGPIMLQKRIDIAHDETALSLQSKLNDLSIEIIREGFPMLLQKPVSLTPQNELKATQVRRRNPEDGYFEWNRPAMEIYNLVRALVAPWPGAWYIENGEKVILDRFIEFSKIQEMQKEKIGRVI